MPNARQASFGAREFYRREGLKKGVPDIVVAWKVEPYAGLYLEMKCRKAHSKVSEDQEDWLARLKLGGYAVEVQSCYEDAWCLIEEYLHGAYGTRKEVGPFCTESRLRGGNIAKGRIRGV